MVSAFWLARGLEFSPTVLGVLMLTTFNHEMGVLGMEISWVFFFSSVS